MARPGAVPALPVAKEAPPGDKVATSAAEANPAEKKTQAVDPHKEIIELSRAMKQAIQEENFVKAAQCRDKICKLKQKIKKVKTGLKKVSNVRVHADVPRWAYIQALLARGDRRVSQLLSTAHDNNGNWPQTLKAAAVNADFYVQRQRSREEMFPCDFIDHGIEKEFLWNEYERAIQAKTTKPCPMDPVQCQVCGVCK